MTLQSFWFSPVFFSVLAFLFYLHKRNDLQKKILHISKLIVISFSVCFAYSLSSIYINERYAMFDDFFLYCFISSLIAMFINIIIYLIKMVDYSSLN